jgi:PKD repeat protein
VNAAASSDPDGTVVSYSWNFGDGATATGVTASHAYSASGSYPITLTVTDDQGATGQSSTTVTVQAPPADAYGQAVIADNPTLYWRLNDASGPTAADATANGNNGAYSGGITYQVPSTVAPGTAVTFDGASGQLATTQAVAAPSVYSEELWFKTTSTSGGTLIAFGDQPSGLSSNHDRQVYLLNSGQLVFGVWTGQNNTVTSAKSYNDGQWHQVVATQGPDGMTLYVDGQAVGANPTTQAQPFTGYWRVGGENLLGWPGPASSNYLAGSIDEVSVYTSELSAARVAAHFAAGGTPNVPPVAAFTPSCVNLVCSFDGTASHDPDGTVASYAWSFGDGSTATGPTAGHTYAAAGDFSVTLTVTDNGGATGTVTQVVSPRPVANPSAAPIASDAFGRTLAAGLGNADLGGAWSSNGTASVLSVTPGKAAITMSKPGVTSGAYLGALSSTNTDTTVTLTTDKAPTGGGIYLAVVGRRLSSTVDYRTRLRLLSNGTVGVSLLSENAGVETLLAGEKILPGVAYTPGMQFNVELQVTGTNPTTLRVKVWQSGQTVPSAWLLTATDSTAALQVPGAVGLVAYLSGSSTLSPVSMLASSFSVSPIAAAPTAAATASCSGLVCTVSAASSTDPSGSITNYQWEWADGILTTGVSSSHTYSRAGTYRVTLTVTDPSGLTSVTTLTLTVPA